MNNTTTKKTTYTVTHPDGTTSTRTSHRPYVAAVVCAESFASIRGKQEARIANYQDMAAKGYRTADEAAQTIQECRDIIATVQGEGEVYGVWSWSSAHDLAAKEVRRFAKNVDGCRFYVQEVDA